MISQPSNNKMVSSAMTIASMPAENSVSAAKKCVYRRSPFKYSVEYNCTKVEMNVTTTNTMTARPSIDWPIVNCIPPICHQSHVRTTGAMNCSFVPLFTRLIHCIAVPPASTRLANILSRPISLPFIGSFLPNKMMIAKPIAGIIGISQACSRNQPDDNVVRASDAANMINPSSPTSHQVKSFVGYGRSRVRDQDQRQPLRRQSQ